MYYLYILRNRWKNRNSKFCSQIVETPNSNFQKDVFKKNLLIKEKLGAGVYCDVCIKKIVEISCDFTKKYHILCHLQYYVTRESTSHNFFDMLAYINMRTIVIFTPSGSHILILKKIFFNSVSCN